MKKINDKEMLKSNKKIKMFYAGFTFFVLFLLLSVSFSGALTRVISSDSDNVKSFIVNSKGNYFEATGSNIIVALEDLGLSGGDVWIPDGTFMLTEEIDLRSGFGSVSIHLSKNTVLKVDESYTDNFLFLVNDDFVIDGYGSIHGNNVSLSECYFLVTSDNVLIKDITIRKTYAKDIIRFIDNDDASGVVDNIRVEDVYSDDPFILIRTYNNFDNVTIKNSVFKNSTCSIYGVIIQSSNCRVINCDFVNTGCLVLNDDSSNCVVQGNRFLNSVDDGIRVLGDDNIIQMNMFKYIGDDGFNLQNSAENNTILNNIFENIGDEEIHDQTGQNNGNVIRNNGDVQDRIYPLIEQDSEPSVNKNSTVYWHDTDDDYMYQIVQTYGTTYYVNMTTTI